MSYTDQCLDLFRDVGERIPWHPRPEEVEHSTAQKKSLLAVWPRDLTNRAFGSKCQHGDHAIIFLSRGDDDAPDFMGISGKVLKVLYFVMDKSERAFYVEASIPKHAIREISMPEAFDILADLGQSSRYKDLQDRIRSRILSEAVLSDKKPKEDDQ